MLDEKQAEPAVEPVVEPVGEITPPAEGEVTPSETYDKEQLAARISAAEASVQSAKDTQIADLRRAHSKELRDLTARQEEANLVRQEEADKLRYSETDPDLLNEMLATRRAIHNTAVHTSDIQAQGYAFKYGRQYGIDPEVLMECTSPEEMETIAKQKSQELEKNAVLVKDGRITALEEELAELKKAPQKIDSGVPAASGVNLSDKSPEETIQYALDHPKK